MALAQRTEMVEGELTRLIEKRHDQRVKSEGERLEEGLWMESSRRYLEVKQRQMQAEHYRFQMDMCELHERLAAEHEERALKLLEDGPEFCARCGRRVWFVIEVVGTDQGGA